MSLSIERIQFRDFRSYENLALEGLGPLNVFVGPNAIGKTNIVEGIQLLTAHTSFRHATIEQMVRRGCAHALLEMSLAGDGRALDVSVFMEEHVKRYKLNGKAKRPSDLKGVAPSVTFTPDDLNLVKGSMSARRHAVDLLGSQLSANYALVAKDYEKVMRYKSRLLKEGASPALLDSIDETLITCGAQLACYRLSLFSRLVPEIKKHYERITSKKERLDMWYAPSWEALRIDAPEQVSFDQPTARVRLEEQLRSCRAQEVARGRAVAGPHADSICFMINGADATVYGSQGQQRSIVLAFKLAEADVAENMIGQKPILLLDDVMSELDGPRREALVSYISDDVQTFITTANLSYFDEGMLAKANLITLPLERK